ncbi:SiaB family protein kinase [Desulfovibrio sp.]
MTPAMFEDYEKFRRDGVMLYFNGPVSQAVLEGIADIMRRRMDSEDTERAVARKVFALLVEQMQNIVRYSCERAALEGGEGEFAQGQVVVGREADGSFFVASGNKIRAGDGRRLSERLLRVQGMNRPDLKAYYRECRRAGPDAESAGAGLGFIEMARHAAKPLDFAIVPVDRDTSFFSVKATA